MTPRAAALRLAALAACSPPRSPAVSPPRAVAHCPEASAPAWPAAPAWLAALVSRGLYVRDGERIVDAPVSDLAVLRSYLDGRDLGPLREGSRLTILAARRVYAVGEPVRVVHVLERTLPGQELYIMGPKAVTGVWVDGSLASAPEPDEGLMPTTYDGAVLPSPGADTNFERSVHRFRAPGLHRVQWRAGGMTSNELCVEVR